MPGTPSGATPRRRDGIGLQDHYARAWAHVAAYFRGNPGVFGYEVLNEPWPGLVWEPCANPVVGCLLNDAKLRAFYNRVVPAIRAADPTTLVFFEPNLLFDEGIHTDLGTVADPNTGFSFHDYCAIETMLHKDITCSLQDRATFNNARRYAAFHRIPALLTEFGATDDLANLAGVLRRADDDRMGWLEWAYTGNDKTSSSPTAQALVFDPSQPPTGANVNTAKLAVLAAPYPQVVAGTPRDWSFRSGTFRLCYSTERADRRGRFPSGAQTLVSVPAIEYPNGYHVTVKGGQVVSPPNSPVLAVVADPRRGQRRRRRDAVTPGAGQLFRDRYPVLFGLRSIWPYAYVAISAVAMAAPLRGQQFVRPVAEHTGLPSMPSLSVSPPTSRTAQCR